MEFEATGAAEASQPAAQPAAQDATFVAKGSFEASIAQRVLLEIGPVGQGGEAELERGARWRIAQRLQIAKRGPPLVG